VTIYEPEDCDERYRQYLEHTPRYTGPTLIPIQVWPSRRARPLRRAGLR